MKKIEFLRNAKASLAAIATAGTMIATAPTLSAEGRTPTVDDIINAMQTGNKISAELSKNEAWELESAAIEKIKKEKTTLLPTEIAEEYNNLKDLKGEARERQLVTLALICDYEVFSNDIEMMTYPESLQFGVVCNEVCNELKDKGFKDIYSYYQSEMYKEETFTSLDVLMERAGANTQRKHSSYIVALGVDLGHYDDCYEIDGNPNTGLDLDLVGVGISGLAAFLSRKKKEKTYQKRR